jgi:Prokaryotic homologs of the JAB domain
VWAVSPVLVTRSVLGAAGAFFEEQGAKGLEGTALIAALDGGPADRLVVPTQQASRADGGCWVEVPLAGKLECAAALRPGERYVARIHSHPGEAFHSATDDRNPALTHQGALSIVVPFFGLGLRQGLDACAVFVLRGTRWVELPAGPARAAWIRTA